MDAPKTKKLRVITDRHGQHLLERQLSETWWATVKDPRGHVIREDNLEVIREIAGEFYPDHELSVL